MLTCPVCMTRHEDGTASCPHDGTILQPDQSDAFNPDLRPGQSAGEYVIEGKLGEGGFGSVYRGVHPVIGKAAAIKVLNLEFSVNPDMVARFVAEARSVNKIRHKNIVDIFSFGVLADGRRFYVMELLEGRPLDELLAGGPMPLATALPLLAGVAHALDAAHAAGVVHRDIKPENIFVSPGEGGAAEVKLLDFGIAKLMVDAGEARTRTGTPMGTPFYMSPEQAGGRAVDHRSDIYSFGIVLYRVLTGRLPFTGDDVVEVLYKQKSATPALPSEAYPALSPAADRPILDMLEKDPAARPRSVTAALDALAAATGVVMHASTPDFSAVSSVSPQLLRVPAPPEVAKAVTLPAVLPPGAPPATTLAVAAPPAARPGGIRVAVSALAVLLVVGGAAALLIGKGRGAEDRPVASAAPGHDGGAPQTSGPAGPSATLSRPAAQPAPTGAPADVALRLLCTPPDAQVYLGDRRLGAAPGPIKLPRASGTTILTLRADGWLPEDIEVSTTEDSSVSVKLTRLDSSPPPSHPTTKPVRRTNRDLESPF